MLPVFLILSPFCLWSQTAGLPTRLAADIGADHDGIVHQRVVADMDVLRVILWSRGSLVLTRERTVPAGMVERQYRLHNPYTESVHRLGLSVGSFVFGPVKFRGSYHRYLDPTTGGAVPGNIDQSTGISLDPSIDPSPWDGVGLSHTVIPPGIRRGPVSPLAFGAAYAVSPDRGRLAIAHVEGAPLAGRLGGMVVTAGSSEILSDGTAPRRDPDSDPWMYSVPEPRRGVMRRLGVTYALSRGGYRDGSWPAPFPLTIFAEGWRQYFSYRTPRHAGQGVVSFGPDLCRLSLRSLEVEPGFLDLDMTPPSRSSFRGGRIEGDIDIFQQGGTAATNVDWRWEVEEALGWDEGLPGSHQRVYRYRVGVESSGFLRRLRMELEYPDEAVTASVILALLQEPRKGISADLDLSYRGNLSSSDGRTTVIASLEPIKGGGNSWNLRWQVDLERAASNAWWRHSGVAQVPIGSRGAVSVRAAVERPGTDRSVWEGEIRLSWYGSGAMFIAPESGGLPENRW